MVAGSLRGEPGRLLSGARGGRVIPNPLLRCFCLLQTPGCSGAAKALAASVLQNLLFRRHSCLPCWCCSAVLRLPQPGLCFETENIPCRKMTVRKLTPSECGSQPCVFSVCWLVKGRTSAVSLNAAASPGEE